MPIKTSVRDEIGFITLDNPAALNAWDMATQRAVTETLRDYDHDAGVEAVVLTGAGERAFCAGQDLKESSGMDHSEVAGWLDSFKQVYDAALSASKPVVAALNGMAVGSGYQMALVCDLRVAHPGVRMGQPEVSSGIPSVTGHYLTALSLGHSRTVDLMLSGRLMEAEEAHRLGLVQELVDREDVLDTAVEHARQLARQPKLAFRLTKQRIRDHIWPGLVESFEAALRIDEEAWASGEPQETARTFFEERAVRKSRSMSETSAP